MTTNPTPPMGATSDGALSERLGRFGHHPDPANDFCVEVEELESIWTDRTLGFPNPEDATLAARVGRAMEFRVGGDGIAVQAKARLRALEDAVRRPASPTPAPEGSDLDRLEALAKAASPGEWKLRFLRTPWSDPDDKSRPFLQAPEVQIDNGQGRTYAAQVYGEDAYPHQLADFEFGEACNPATVLALIAELRRLRAGEAAPSDTENDVPECEHCGGTGKIVEEARSTGSFRQQHSASQGPCDACDGTGLSGGAQ